MKLVSPRPRGARALASSICVALLACPFAGPAPAHGGTYRNPNLPPPPLGTPGSGSANTGGPSTTGGGIKHTDPAAWSQWWALSRDMYMPRVARVFDGKGSTGASEGKIGAGLRTPDEVLRGLVVPGVLVGLYGGDDVDLLTASLMALAKIGQTTDDEDPPDLVEVLSDFLDHDHPEVAEAAVVALGVLGDRAGALHLAELLRDSRAGRKLVKERQVPPRMRAYAAYGLAVLGAAAEGPSVRTFVVHQLVAELDERRPASEDISVACVLGLGLVPLREREPLEEGETPLPTASRAGQVAYLLSLLEARRFDDVVKSFVPVAAARLVADSSAGLEERVGSRLIDLARPLSRVDEGVRASAIQALGLVGDDDLDELDVSIREVLTKSYEVGGRLQRNLALVALGRVGGRAGNGARDDVARQLRKELMKRVVRGQSSEKPWAALAVGILEHGRIQQGGEADAETRLALRQQFESAGNPSFSGALAVALGLCGDAEAAPLLMERLNTGDETVRAHAATGLGLMRARAAIEPLRALAGSGPPGIAREAAIALALIGDKEAWNHLDGAEWSAAPELESLSDLLSLAYFGDSRAVVALIEVVVDRRASAARRAYALVALGVVCDKDPVTWNHPLAQDAVWWSAPPTLLDSKQGLGVVDFY